MSVGMVGNITEFGPGTSQLHI